MNYDKKSENPLEDLRKAQEEEYFRKQNAQTAEKLKAKLDMEKSGIKDEGLRQELVNAGFDADSIRALFIVPLVEVAWADGCIDSKEKSEVLKTLSQRDINPESKAYALVSLWLSKKPTDENFMKARSLMEPFLEECKKSGTEKVDWVLKASKRVAEATGNLFEIRSNISKEEEKVLSAIVKKLS